MNSGDAFGAMEAQYIGRHHRHEPRENQCTSALVKHIKAPVHLVCFSLLSTADHHFLWFLFHFHVVDFFDFFFFARILGGVWLFSFLFWTFKIWVFLVDFKWFCLVHDVFVSGFCLLLVFDFWFGCFWFVGIIVYAGWLVSGFFSNFDF